MCQHDCTLRLLPMPATLLMGAVVVTPPKVSITSQGQLITHSPNIYLRVSTLPHRAMQSDVAAAATLVLLLRLATCNTVNF